MSAYRRSPDGGLPGLLLLFQKERDDDGGGGGTPSAPKGQTLLHPQAPQEQAGEEHDDRDKRHLSDCVHGLAIYRAETPLKKKPRYAIYTKPTGQPQLVLVSSNATRDHQLRARAWQ
jgi:hypothetical protein